MHSFIQDISIAPLQVHYYSEAMFPLIYLAMRELACLVSSNIRDLCLLYASRKMLCALVEKSCACSLEGTLIVRDRRKTIPQEGTNNSERPKLNHSFPSPGNKEDRWSRLSKERRGRRDVSEKVYLV